MAAPAFAATTTTTFGVTANVVPTCTVSASPLNFGEALPSTLAANIDAQGSVTAMCSNAAAYTVALSVGSGAGATFGSRKLTSGANALNYTLYLNAARTNIWGEGRTPVAPHFNGIGTGIAQILPVYGRVRSGQTVPVGSYSDLIVVTLTF